MKIKSIFAWVLAVGMFSSCSKDDVGSMGPDFSDGTVAYLSVKIATEPTTRVDSDEQEGTQEESELNSIYLLTFNNAGTIVGIPETSDFFIKLTGNEATETPDVQKVSAKATKMFVVVNPGPKLIDVMGAMNSTTTFETINAAIASVSVTEIVDNTGGFTMVNSVEDSGLNVLDVVSDPLIDISGSIYTAANEGSDAAAEQKAKDFPVKVKIERLATKIELKLKGNNGSGIVASPSGASFEFGAWTLDALNTSFYPYAKKTILSAAHVNSLGTAYYKYNFYTEDPNFVPATVGEGLVKTTINKSGDYSPILPHGTDWKSAPDTAYRIENTMAAAEQKYGNATRVVIKGKYYPVSTWNGDWFSFAGINYEDLATLQAAYNGSAAGSNLRNACEAMYTKIKGYADLNSITIGGNFAALTQPQLDLIPNGGEIVKNGANPVIRWYQKGLSYYYYEIQHEENITDPMAFGKYGVVRNNWYELTLATVKGPGTPWYPDIDNPGPGDPDPTDPIDEEAGFLGIEIKVAPWIFWSREIGI